MDRLPPRVARWLPLLFALPVLWHLFVLARVFASRMTYPMDVEWMEGGELYHAYRWLHGQSVYGAPAQGFVPFGYPPFHVLLLTAMGAVVGLDYGMGRALSIACFAAIAAVWFRELWRQQGGGAFGAAMGALAVGIAAAGFPVTGGWYDLVRNDTLAMALPMLAAALVVDTPLGTRRLLLVAGLLTASVYTKQTNVLFAVWIGIFVLVRDRRRGLLLGGVTLLASGVLFAIAQAVTGGWFLTWITLMGHHKLNFARLTSGPLIVVEFAPYLRALPFLVTFLALRRWLSARGALWTGMLVASVPASILPHIKVGGFVNNLMPLVVLAGGTTLVLLGDLVAGLRRDGWPRTAVAVTWGTLAAAAVVLVVKTYDPAPYLIPTEQRQKAVALNQFVRDLEGGVLIPSHPFLAARNGVVTPQAHAMAQWDAVSGGVPQVDLFRIVAASSARWLMIQRQDEILIAAPSGKYTFDRMVDVAVPTLAGHRTAPDALFRRIPE